MAVGGCPDFGAQKAETPLNEAVVKVGQHYVVAADGGFGIESDGTLLAGVRMDQTGQARLPGGVGEVGKSKARGTPSSVAGMRRAWRASSSAI